MTTQARIGLPPQVFELEIFQGLNARQKGFLEKEGFLDVAPPGSVFAYQGEYTGRFRVILEGLVSAYREEPNGETINLWTLGAGDTFGELSALSNRPEPAMLRADSRCVFVVIEQELFKQLYKGKIAFKTHVDRTYRERTLVIHLRVAPLFKGLTEKQISLLKGKVEILDFEKGQVIARGGQDADALYVIRSGAVKCVGRDDKGREKILAYYMDNSAFGERAFSTKRHRWAGNYETMAATAAIKLSRAMMEETFGDAPDVIAKLNKAADLIAAYEEGAASDLFDRELEAARREGFTTEQLELMVGKQSIKGGEALVIDLLRCIRCNACVESCVAVHEDRVPRISKTGNRVSTQYNLASSCYNCEIPECMMACDFGAIRRDVQGLIRFVWDNCVGCQACTTACPYGVIAMTPPPPAMDYQPRFKRHWFLQTLPFIGHKFAGNHPVGKAAAKAEQPVVSALRGTKVSGKAVKCDLCAGLPFQACVYNCPASAISRVNPEDIFAEDGSVKSDLGVHR
ncbi:MAG: cyclic nucleotide-binding domain-containing protein [Planctomycetes bacterium]|nr:cyclic nucleotide-binding domain-containing protein [Planctomycetota bacterium]